MKGTLFSKKEQEAKILQLWGAVLSLVLYAVYMAARLIQYGETASYYSDGWYAYLIGDLIWGLPNIVLLAAVFINDKLKGKARAILMALTGLEAFIACMGAIGRSGRSFGAFVETEIIYNQGDLWSFIFLVEIVLFILIPGINKLLLQITLLGVTGIYAAAFILDVMLTVVSERPIESSSRWIALAALTVYRLTLYFFACEISSEKPTVYTKLFKKIRRWIEVNLLDMDSDDVSEADIADSEAEGGVSSETANVRRSMADIDFYDSDGEGDGGIIDKLFGETAVRCAGVEQNRGLLVRVAREVSEALSNKENERIISTEGDPDLGIGGGKLAFGFEYGKGMIKVLGAYSFDIDGNDVEYYEKAAKEMADGDYESIGIFAKVEKSEDGDGFGFNLYGHISRYVNGEDYSGLIEEILYYLILIITELRNRRK